MNVFGLGLCLTLTVLSVNGSYNVYMRESESKKVLGIEQDLYYVKDGKLNDYALGFLVLVPDNMSQLEFTWQNLKNKPLPYRIEIKTDNPEAMNSPKLDIPRSGTIPSNRQSFVVSLPCSEKVTAEVRVTIKVDVMVDDKNTTSFSIPRRKVCHKDEGLVERVSTTTAAADAYDDIDDDEEEELEEEEEGEGEGTNTVYISEPNNNNINNQNNHSPKKKNKGSANTAMVMDSATTTVVVAADRNPMFLAVGAAAVLVAMAFMLATTVCYVKSKKLRQTQEAGNIIIQTAADKYFQEWATANSTIKTTSNGYGVITSNVTPIPGQKLLRVGSPVASTVASYSSYRKASPLLSLSMNRDHNLPPKSAMSQQTLQSESHYSSIEETNTSTSSVLSEQIAELSIDSKCFTLVRLLNEGAFGQVYHAVLNDGTCPESDSQSVLVKTVTEQASQNQLSLFLHEGMMLSSMNHANVLPVVATCIDNPSKPVLIYPFMSEGNLKQFLRRSKFSQTQCHHCLTTQDLVDIAVQIAEGIMYLHRRFFLHKDIATRNCMIDERLHVKITDNALSRDIHAEDYHCLGDNENRPVKWLAIESLENREFTPASDLWMFGVTLWELLTLGQQPYEEVDPFEMHSYLLNGYRLSQPVNCPDELYDVMQRCWNASPSERLTFPQVLRILANFYNHLGSYI